MSNEEYTVEVKGLTYGREAIGVITEGEESRIGKKAFVEFTVPGETVTVQTKKEEKSFIRAELLQILEPSPFRVVPPCEIFGKCGGCELQHIEPNKQRDLKEDMVLTMLSKQAGIIPLKTSFLGKDIQPWNYRNRITLHVGPSGTLGFLESSSTKVVDTKYCYISSPQINKGLETIRKFLHELSDFVVKVTIQECEDLYIDLELNSAGQLDNFKPSMNFYDALPNTTLSYEGEVVYAGTGKEFPTGHFSQVNDQGNQILIKAVCDLIKSPNLQELFAGSGNFTIPLAKLGKNIEAVEIDPVLVAYGKKIAAQDKVEKNIKFTNSSCEKFVKNHKLGTTVLLDPPRSGAKNILPAFEKSQTKQIVYVSCDLPNFCRDAKILTSYGYKLDRLYLIDMFPQTHHIELLANFTR